ncbi:uncharacterized protein LOC134265524, partial [Saccostrea cucullata]|uniref:uncharacterized protein LOC134265524 n=1 Tax=Saccostrea cuccullata TaxID=36930 RepID=UPI002ED0ADFF
MDRSDQCACTSTVQENDAVCDNRLFMNTQMDFYSATGYLEYTTLGATNLKVNGTGDCAAVILVNGTNIGLMHEFLPCDKQLPYLCQSNTAEIRINAILHKEDKNWTEAVKSCSINENIVRGSFDGYYALKDPPISTIMAWTGISRRIINHWSSGIIDTTDSYDCLAVSKDSENSTVQIHAKNCSDLLPDLCERSGNT